PVLRCTAQISNRSTRRPIMNLSRKFLVALTLTLITGCRSNPISKRDGYFNSGEKYLADGRYEEALIQFRNALQIDHNHVPTYLELGKLFQKTGDFQNAVASFQ